MSKTASCTNLQPDGGPSMRKFLCAATVCALLVATPAYALTGAELNDFCTNPTGSAKNQVCQAYIRGVAEGLELAEVYKSKLMLCMDRLNLEDPVVTRLTVETYMRENPGELRREAALVVILALLSECDKWDKLPPTDEPKGNK
jgi:Rap1a immunity proteins